MIEVAPSMLSADFLHLEAEIDKVIRSGADFVHYDVMDGSFVKNITFGQVILRRLTSKPIPFDVHLMIQHPETQIDDFAQAGAYAITIHEEATRQPRALLQAIRAHHCLAGISVKPETPIETIFDLIDDLDWVLVMTVEPGKGGQAFMADQLVKVRALRAELARRGRADMRISVDGGINLTTAAQAVAAGVNVLVTGSTYFQAPDPADFVARLKAL